MSRTAPTAHPVLSAALTISHGDFSQQVPGVSAVGLPSGASVWTPPPATGLLSASRIAIEADLRDQPSGRYDFAISAGLFVTADNGATFTGTSKSSTGTLTVVNEINSPFGSGWGMSGIIKLVVNKDGSVLLIDGDGTQFTYEKPSTNGAPYVSPSGDFAVLEKQPDGRFRRTMPDQTVHQFNTDNRLASMTDRNNNQTLYQYDASGNLLTITDPVGLTTTFAYQNGRLASITDPANRVTTFQVDATGDLVQITDPDGTTRHFEYDADHRMTAEVDRRGAREQMFYDSSGRIQRVIHRDGTEIRYQTVQRGAVAQKKSAADTTLASIPPASTDITTDALMVEPSGNVVRLALDKAGQTVSTRDSVGLFPNVTRNRNNMVTSVTDARGNRTGFRYDNRGNLTARFDSVAAGNQPALAGRLIATKPGFGGSGTTADFNGDHVPDIVVADPFGQSILVFLSQGSSHGAVNYGAPQEITVGQGPSKVVVLDVNGDSKPDLATLNVDRVNFGDDSTISVLVGDGHGGFSPRRDFAIGNRSSSMAVADFNGDGFADLIVNGVKNAALSVLLADGSGGLRSPMTIPFQAAYGHVAAGDINRDHKADFVLADLNDSVHVYRGRGDGTFDAPQAYVVSPGPFEVAVADVTGDGNPDVVSTSNFETKFTVLAGDGVGGFPFRNDIDTPGFPISMQIADVDGGGIPDVVLVEQGGGLDVRSLVVHPGERALAPVPPVATGSFGDPSITDLNGDGQLDAVLFGTGAVEQLFGRADGAFAGDNFIPVSAMQTASLATVGDFNGDGLTDLVAASHNDNTGASTGSVFLRRDDGTLGLAGTVDLGVGTNAALTSADIIGDGALDLVLAKTFATNGEVDFFTGDGAGTFQSPSCVCDPPTLRQSLVVDDFNGDGRLDMAAVLPIFDKVEVNDFVFNTTRDYSVGDEPQVVRSADLNLDGFPDLVTANKAGSSVTILLGDGTGAFLTPTNIAVPGNPTDVIVGDFNADGFPDLVVNQSDVTKLTLLAGNGKGQFGQQTVLTVDTSASAFALSGRTALAAADLDNDEKTDIIVAQDDVVHVLFSNGAGTFSQVSFQTNFDGSTPNSNQPFVLAADVDNNFATDLVVVESMASGVTILPNTSGSVRHWTYDSKFSQVTSFTDELGRKSLYDIDPANGNTKKITRIVGKLDATSGQTDDQVTQMTYNTRGQVATMTDPLGRVTEYQYDALGRLKMATFAKGTAVQAATQYEYDAAGNVSAVIDANGHRTEYTFDALNRVTKTVYPDPDGAGQLAAPTFVRTFDASGNLLTASDALGNKTKWSYDPMDRPITVTDALNEITKNDYDNVGNLIRTTDPLGHATQYQYDLRKRSIAVTDPSGARTRFKYDADNNETSLIDPLGNETRSLFDARSRVVSRIDPLGAATTNRYDGTNQLLQTTDRNGRATKSQYDDLGRLVKQTWLNADGSPQNVIDYTYDKANNVLTTHDNFSSLTATYDARNRLATVSNASTPGAPTVSLTYQYDAASNLLSVADTIGGQLGATTAQSFDALDRITQLTQSGGGISSKRVAFSYDANGQITQMNRSADLLGRTTVVNSTMQFDVLHRLTSLVHKDGLGTVVESEALQFDAASRVTKITDLNGTTNYTHDNRDQLTAADHSAAGIIDEQYAYDANGNRTSSQLADKYQTGTGNRLLSDGKFNYAYDAEGNLVKRTEIATGKQRELAYDNRNRLISVIDKDSQGASLQRTDYAYDALNRRISRSVNTSPGSVTSPPVDYFVYDHLNAILDFTDSDGTAGPLNPTLAHRYLFGPAVDQVLAQDDGAGGVQWLLADHEGTVRNLVNNSGAVVNHLVYDSFGNVVAQTAGGPATRYEFTGREFDPSVGLFYYRARYYDAAIGRFLSEDPLGFGAGDPNQYRYANNNPVMNVDPAGLWGKPCTPPESDEDKHIKPLKPDEEEYIKSLKPRPDELVLIRADQTDIQVGKNPDTWHKSFLGENLKAGDQISTGPDGEAHLLFPDGSVMAVKGLTQLFVSTLLEQKSALKAQVMLKIGEVSATINPKKVLSTDFSVRTPANAASSRG